MLRAISARSLLWALAIVVCSGLAAEPLPWEVWLDLSQLPVLHRQEQVLLRGSHCPDGCRFDRHSEGDWRYLDVDGDEGTIFEESGAGAITRLWMTMGAGISEPLDPDIRLRIYVDGASTPVVDLPIPELFDGSHPPFVPPLVGGRLISSGGNFSYVPIPYRRGCRVTLVGAHTKRIWFQIHFHRRAEAEGVVSFTGAEDLSGLSDLLSSHGQDPWPPGSGLHQTGATTLEPGVEQSLLALNRHGSLTALALATEPSLWPELELRLAFDGATTVQMPLADFFARGLLRDIPSCALMFGVDDAGFLYTYFPMPFFESVEVSLIHHGAVPVSVDYRIRVQSALPAPESGLFGAELRHTLATTPGVDTPWLNLEGHGKLVGTFIELGSTVDHRRLYLEGDERIFIDRSPHPAVYGTGVEDYFAGGFYFDQGPFALALHGAHYTALEVGGLPTTAAYRLMLNDGVTFENHLQAGLEGGPTGELPMRSRTVTYYYLDQQPRLHLWDRLDLGSPSDRAAHDYEVVAPHVFQPLVALFEGEPAQEATGTGVYRPPGEASFVLRAHPTSTLFRLRRRLDAGVGGQRATVRSGGETIGAFPAVDLNEARRWREVDVDLRGGSGGDGELRLTVVAEPGPHLGTADDFTAFRYELWADGAAAIFADGFESGDASAWSGVTLSP